MVEDSSIEKYPYLTIYSILPHTSYIITLNLLELKENVKKKKDFTENVNIEQCEAHSRIVGK